MFLLHTKARFQVTHSHVHQHGHTESAGKAPGQHWSSCRETAVDFWLINTRHCPPGHTQLDIPMASREFGGTMTPSSPVDTNLRDQHTLLRSRKSSHTCSWGVSTTPEALTPHIHENTVRPKERACPQNGRVSVHSKLRLIWFFLTSVSFLYSTSVSFAALVWHPLHLTLTNSGPYINWGSLFL